MGHISMNLPAPLARRSAHRPRAAIAALLLCLWLALPALPAEARPAAPRRVPAFHLPTLTGTVSPDSLRGKVTLVDFWASWCGPCRRSFPWLSGLYARHAAQGFTVLAINLDKSRDLADEFLAQFPAPFTVAFDPQGRTAESFGVSAMPMSYLVGRDGTILASHLGFDPRDTGPLEHQVEEACRR